MDLLYSCFYQTGKRNIFAKGAGQDFRPRARRANHHTAARRPGRTDMLGSLPETLLATAAEGIE
jgi:hypothetical protein